MEPNSYNPIFLNVNRLSDKPYGFVASKTATDDFR